MITILSLAFGTLAQQLVSTAYRSIPVAQEQGIASVVRSEYYAKYADGPWNIGKILCGRSPGT